VSGTPGRAGPAGRLVRPTARVVASFGLVHALLFLGAYLLLSSTPGALSRDDEIVSFYQTGNRRRLILVGLYVMPFAGIAFLWFVVTLRAWIRGFSGRAGGVIPDIQLLSGVLYVGLFFVGAAASSVTAMSVEFTSAPVDAMVARQFPMYGRTLLVVIAMRMAAMFVFATSHVARVTGILPRWFGLVGLAVGLFLLLSATLSRALVLVFPLWLIAFCVLLFLRGEARATPRAETEAAA
jgi:hypothetical protein